MARWMFGLAVLTSFALPVAAAQWTDVMMSEGIELYWAGPTRADAPETAETQRLDAIVTQQYARLLPLYTAWFKLPPPTLLFTDATKSSQPAVSIGLGNNGAGYVMVSRSHVMRFSATEWLAVLAHELGHIAAQHTVHTWWRNVGLQQLNDSPVTLQAVLGTFEKYKHQQWAKEYEADAIGLRLVKATGEKAGMAYLNLMMRLRDFDDGSESNTHPSRKNRVKALNLLPFMF